MKSLRTGTQLVLSLQCKRYPSITTISHFSLTISTSSAKPLFHTVVHTTQYLKGLLMVFLVYLYHINTPIPTQDVSGVEQKDWELDTVKFDKAASDWSFWSQKKAFNKAIFGSIPPVCTKEHGYLLEENQ
ncbi:hypothetical protein L210DRAFT_3504519 [Boletus edulis BED1]|uniref:Uncharacterized protein n=1 Tax=Boletus edulis BED1 TaxID=1328754 RepID=A0AAD4BTU5_BOLED|nr:hypothetical protein L210DRAFT_3504519 [Boletus edulis BED1]